MDNYNFPVELQPMFLSNGQEIANRKAVVRTDTMQTLGLVSNDYGLVKHSTVIDTFRKNVKQDVTEKVNLTHDGAVLFYQMMFPKVESEIRKGDLVRMQMIVKNSYNGSNTLQIIFGAFRLVCSNGMILGTKFLSFNFKHIGEVGGINDEMVQNSFVEYVNSFSDKMETVKQMSRVPATITDDAFNPKKIEMPQYLLDEAKTSFQTEQDKTVWGYYNALTFAVSHKLKSENPGLAIYFGQNAWKAAEGQLVN